MATKKELTKEEKIKREISRLKRALRDLDKNKLTIVEPLIKSAAFMAVSLPELEKAINSDGYTTTYQNGKDQYGTRQSDEVKTLLAMQKNLTAAVKTLADIAPATQSKSSRLKELLNE